MGHRALVAFRRPDHLYDLRYSHWGGDDLALTVQIDADSPLGGGTVDSRMLADSIALDRILVDHLDPCVHEALYLVSETYTVDPYRVFWFEWSNERDTSRGAIVSVEPGAHDCEVLNWFQATKTVLGDIIEMGSLSRRAAVSYLEARVCEEQPAQPYTYGASEITAHSVPPTVTTWTHEEH